MSTNVPDLRSIDLDPERLIPALIGRSIIGADVGDSGFHMALDDGRVLICTGMFVIALMPAEKATLQ